MAVALPDDNLIVPVIKKSEELNFLGIARSCSDLAQRARLNKLQPFLKKHPRVLDFGCGSGEFIDLMQNSGSLASGFEPGSLYAAYAREQKGLDVQNCGWENYECKEKLEHA